MKLHKRAEEIAKRLEEYAREIKEVERMVKEIEDMKPEDLPPGKDKIDLLIQVLTKGKV